MVSIKEQDGGKHAIGQNSCRIDTHKEESNGSGEVHQHCSQHCAPIDTHPLVCGEVTQPADTRVSLFLDSQVQA